MFKKGFPTCALLVLLTLIAHAEEFAAVKRVWASRFGGRGYDRGLSVDLDRAGSVFVLSATGNAFRLAKYAGEDGTPLWQVPLGNDNTQFHYGLAVDANGAANTFATHGGHVSDVIHYSTDGLIEWRQRFAGVATAIAVDHSGDVIVTGLLMPGVRGVTFKYARNTGIILWLQYHGPGNSFRTITCDHDDNVLLGGAETVIRTLKCAGKNGQVLWQRDFHPDLGSDHDTIVDIAVDPEGNVAVAGYL